MKKLEIKLPFAKQVNDYHEFKSIQSLLTELSGKKIKFKEMGFDGYYHAVFYLKIDSEVENIIKYYKLKRDLIDD